MNSAWATILLMLCSIIVGAAINLIVVGFYVGRYTADVETTKQDVAKLRRELERLARQFAAYSGIANGTDYREEN